MEKTLLKCTGVALCLLSVLFAGCGNKMPELSMVYVEGGSFVMGATDGQDSDAYDSEKPMHRVTLDDFYIGRFEVTQAQWEAVMGTTMEQQRGKASAQSGRDMRLCGVRADCPMYYISWNEAVQFCDRLSERTGKQYRLPTEAEWEYAARGGQNNDGTTYAGSNDIEEVAWYEDNSHALGRNHPDYGTHPVGQKKPNGLGLYDMTGNVWEWCSDWYDSDYYGGSTVINPQGPSAGSGRVLRGGSWSRKAFRCRVTNRDYNSQDGRCSGIGFRVVCER